MGLTQSKSRYKNIDNAISLVTELNSFTKCVITPMRGHYNVTGIRTGMLMGDWIRHGC